MAYQLFYMSKQKLTELYILYHSVNPNHPYL